MKSSPKKLNTKPYLKSPPITILFSWNYWLTRKSDKKPTSSRLNCILGEWSVRLQATSKWALTQRKQTYLERCKNLTRDFACANKQIKLMFLADWVTAVERGRSRESISLSVMNPESKRSEEILFCPQIYKQIQKINNILRQYKCKTVPLCQLHTACLHIENDNSSFTDGYGSALFKNALIILIFVSGAEILWKELHLQLIKYFQEQIVHFVRDL